MTKLTEMCATQRRRVASNHRVEANLAKTQKDKLKGFSPRFLKLSAKEEEEYMRKSMEDDFDREYGRRYGSSSDETETSDDDVIYG